MMFMSHQGYAFNSPFPFLSSFRNIGVPTLQSAFWFNQSRYLAYFDSPPHLPCPLHHPRSNLFGFITGNVTHSCRICIPFCLLFYKVSFSKGQELVPPHTKLGQFPSILALPLARSLVPLYGPSTIFFETSKTTTPFRCSVACGCFMLSRTIDRQKMRNDPLSL